MPAYSKVLVKGSCYLYTKGTIPTSFKSTININNFFHEHPVCEICKNEKTTMVLINNGVFVGVCYSCADGMTAVDIKKEPIIKKGSKNKKTTVKKLVFA